MSTKRSRSGFTLPEVLVTVTVVAVLAAVVVPAVTQYASKGDTPAFRQAYNSLGTAITTYVTDKKAYPTKLSDIAAYAGGFTVSGTANTDTGTSPGYGSLTLKNLLETTDKTISGASYLTALVTTAAAGYSCRAIDKAIDDGNGSDDTFKGSGIFQYGTDATPCINA